MTKKERVNGPAWDRSTNITKSNILFFKIYTFRYSTNILDVSRGEC